MYARSRQVVYDETLPIEMAAAELDLERLRRGFAELFDRAAQAVQLAGYEQDDVVLERFLIVRTVCGEEMTLSAEWLSDRERLVQHLVRECRGIIGQRLDFSDVRVIGLRIAAGRDEWG